MNGNIDQFPIYTKQELAEIQLNRAITLLLDEKDIVCAITLAGAAEEILGKLLERRGGTHALKEFTDDCVSIGKQMGENWSAKSFADMVNNFRNELKHIASGSEVILPIEAAHEIIHRAAENLRRLSDHQSELVCRFYSEVYYL